MIIRKMIESDIADLSLLYEQFWGEKSCTEKMRKTFQKINADPNHLILNAILEGKLVGSILGIIAQELYGECLPFMIIEDFIVDKDYRHKGIGKSLISEMEKYATKNNCCQIILITENHRTDTIRFYESVGYNPDTHKGFKKALK